MAGEFNAGFHQNQNQNQNQHQHQQQGMLYSGGGGAMSNSSSGGSGGYELIPMGNYYNSPGGNLNDGGIQIFSSSAAQSNSMGSPSTLLLDSVPGLKHDTGLAVEWSVEEQFKLEEALAKYANEPKIMRYIKIAASLHDKTVRDVALRCRWMARKRRKQEDQSLGKKVKDRKDKFMESSLKNNICSASSLNVPPYSVTTNHHQNEYAYSVPSCTTRHLLEENNQAFGQISANLSTLKLQENINLFSHTRNNITAILNDMRNMPGIMSRMPPLPVLLNEELASSIFPHSAQFPSGSRSINLDKTEFADWGNPHSVPDVSQRPMMFGSIPLKREPGC